MESERSGGFKWVVRIQIGVVSELSTRVVVVFLASRKQK
jgi:hypothetical protein